MSDATVEGTVLRITATNGRWFAAKVKLADGREVSVSGASPRTPQIESRVVCKGTWTRHEKYGDQFKFETMDETLPATKSGQLRMLESLPGIGPKRAEQLYEKFGDDAVRVCMERPEELRALKGMGEWAEKAADELVQRRDSFEVERQLCEYQFGPRTRENIMEHFKTPERLVKVLAINPYRLVEVRGVSFAKVDDSLMRTARFAFDSVERAAAACVEGIKVASEDGDTWCPVDSVGARLAALKLRQPIPPDMIPRGCDRAVHDEQLKVVYEGDRAIGYALPWLYDAEDFISARLREMLGATREAPSGKVSAETMEQMTDEQRSAVELVRERGVCVVTGGPGTGKTWTLQAILDLVGRDPSKTALLAPTGKAARRAFEVTGFPAETMHRFWFRMKLVAETGGDAERYIPENIVLDETSMVDADILAKILRAVPRKNLRLVFVGDADQLPSVGPGSILRDLLACGAVPSVRLTRIMRQAQESRIVSNAHRINGGVAPVLSGDAPEDRDWYEVFGLKDDALSLQGRLVSSVERACKRWGYDIRRGGIQVLAPLHKGPLGVGDLNTLLRAKFNPGGKTLKIGADWSMRVGDRVLVTRNDYKLGVVNGDQGVVVDVQERRSAVGEKPARKDMVAVELDSGDTVEFEGEAIWTLQQAWAMTIHKSQGSEYPCVVVACHDSHYFMLKDSGRSLLYTAVTRAKERLVLVGTRSAVEMAVRGATTAARLTRLAGLMKHI